MISRRQRAHRAPIEIPRVIAHANMDPLLDAISADPYFSQGPPGRFPRPEWVDQIVTLEFPLGELARDGLTTLALVGRERPEPLSLTGKEGFDAQGLEGKVQLRKPLFNALMNLRDLLPVHRGRILVDAPTRRSGGVVREAQHAPGPRDEILRRYSVDRYGRITDPGKFEGEMLYVPHFWNVFLDGFSDFDDGEVVGFRLTPEDKAQFPELGRKRTVRLVERDDGFVVEV